MSDPALNDLLQCSKGSDPEKEEESGITIEGPDGLCDHLPNLSISVGKGMIHNCDGSSNGE
jgi:hypothetical protein